MKQLVFVLLDLLSGRLHYPNALLYGGEEARRMVLFVAFLAEGLLMELLQVLVLRLCLSDSRLQLLPENLVLIQSPFNVLSYLGLDPFGLLLSDFREFPFVLESLPFKLEFVKLLHF